MSGSHASEDGRSQTADTAAAALRQQELTAIQDAIGVPQRFLDEHPQAKFYAGEDPIDGRSWRVDVDDTRMHLGVKTLTNVYISEIGGNERYMLSGLAENMQHTDHSRGVKGAADYEPFSQTPLEIAAEAKGLLERILGNPQTVQAQTH